MTKGKKGDNGNGGAPGLNGLNVSIAFDYHVDYTHIAKGKKGEQGRPGLPGRPGKPGFSRPVAHNLYRVEQNMVKQRVCD